MTFDTANGAQKTLHELIPPLSHTTTGPFTPAPQSDLPSTTKNMQGICGISPTSRYLTGYLDPRSEFLTLLATVSEMCQSSLKRQMVS